ncbi:hypothetical protein [Rhizobium sp. RHZ01]|uniref:hypothetical protein n=1 Tax=Rhizobium sp. RHZ01 TaxID=2769304 RepID=UPI001786F6F2|nr:hypothetical protein [Rhizobium sp. RHZ01]MBD9449733.1 hypothetical protein [Rhizobium sp. RHZ01]
MGILLLQICSVETIVAVLTMPMSATSKSKLVTAEPLIEVESRAIKRLQHGNKVSTKILKFSSFDSIYEELHLSRYKGVSDG